MPRTRQEVMAACEMLACIALDMEKRLATEPAWLALRQLEERNEEGRPLQAVDEAALKARLLARVDASAPGWQLLDAVKEAVAVLDAGLRRASSTADLHTLSAAADARATKPPPLAGPPQPMLAAWPKEPVDVPSEDVATILRRIRTIDSRKAPGAPPAPAPQLPRTIAEAPQPTAMPAAAPLEEEQAAARPTGEAMPRPPAAMPAPSLPAARPAPSAQTSAARLVALEAEVERLLAGELASLAGEQDGTEANRPGDPFRLDEVDAHLPVEEALVEIVVPPAAASTAATVTADGLDDDRPRVRGPAVSVALEAYLDEASVEIVTMEPEADSGAPDPSSSSSSGSGG